MRKLLLDTNAYVALAKGNPQIIQKLNECDQLFFSNFVIAELEYGFALGIRTGQNKEILNKFLTSNYISVVQTTRETASIYSEIKATLKRSGKHIPTNDIWIAAHSMEYGCTLITFDKHFLQIEGLRRWPI